MAQSGKDAILAAARRIAELDSDDDDTADDGDWANWGGIDWKNLDVDDEAEEHAARETSAESEARTAEALGIPIRLARWLARHKGGDVRRAFHVATRNRSTGAPTPDADGTIALGNRRPKYVPLEERVVAVKPAAMPTKRTDDFETLRRAKEARERTEARRREVAAGCARAIAEEQKKENVAMTPVARAAVAQALVSRDQRPDLAPGAGPAGRHEPSAVGARRPVDAASAVGANVSAMMSLMGVGAAAGTPMPFFAMSFAIIGETSSFSSCPRGPTRANARERRHARTHASASRLEQPKSSQVKSSERAPPPRAAKWLRSRALAVRTLISSSRARWARARAAVSAVAEAAELRRRMSASSPCALAIWSRLRETRPISASALAEIGLVSRNRDQIANAQGLEALIRLLSSAASATAETAARALAHLAREDEIKVRTARARLRSHLAARGGGARSLDLT